MKRVIIAVLHGSEENYNESISFLLDCKSKQIEVVEIFLINGLSDHLVKRYSFYKIPTSLHSVSDISDNYEYDIGRYLESLGADEMIILYHENDISGEHISDYLCVMS